MSDSTTLTAGGAASSTEFLGHPRGLATLFFTEMWERFSYYGMRALLILFMTAAAARGGLAVNAETAGAVYGLYTAAVYLFSLPGGWIADRLLGQRRSVFWGGVLISGGNFLLAVPGSAALVYVALLVIAAGTGLLKPNASVMVGELYRGASGSRRDAAFSIFYLGINLGAFIAPLIAGTIGETVGYRWGFFTSGIAMVLGLIQYRATGHWLGEAGREPHAASPGERRRNVRLLGAGVLLLALVTAAAYVGLIPVNVFTLASAAGIAMVALAVLVFGAMLAARGLTPIEKRRIVVIALFFVCSAVFWGGYEQAGSTLNLFARDYTDRSAFGSFFPAHEHPASWYQSIEALFVLMLAPLFAWLWMALGSRGRDPAAPTKLGLGLLQLGCGFLVMMLASRLVLTSGHKALPEWLVLTYLLHTTGELCLSPIGLSNVTKLAPQRYVGQMMGTWFLGMAIGNLVAGLVGGEVGGGSLAAMPAEFLRMALVGVGAGAVMLAISPRVRAWMGGVD